MTPRKVLLVCPPFAGHLHPMLGIGRGLAAVAEVTVVSTAGGVKEAAASGLRGREVMAGCEGAIRAISEPGYTVGNHPVRLYRQFAANVALMAGLKAELEALYRAEQPALVIADFTLPVAGLAAAARGIPWWTTLVSPCILETADGSPAYFGGQTPPRTHGQALKQAAMRRAIRSFKRLMWGLFRKPLRALGFEGVYRADGSEAAYSGECILGLGVAEIEFPCTFPPSLRLVGPVRYTPPFEGPAPVFEPDGRPHVLVSLGTHLPHLKAEVYERVRAVARRRPGIVFHFARGDASAPLSRREDNFHEYAYVSYAEHLPRYDLVVHHAGTGIMHYCLHHALPSVIFPCDYDQFDSAARLAAAGVAVRLRRLRDLEEAVAAALADAGLHARCREMSGVYARYDAVDAITEMVRSRLG